MKSSVALLLAAVLLASNSFRPALPGYRYEFPRDYFSHPDFQTEWWYYTGNLRSPDGRRFGFELTFFRHALQPAAKQENVWAIRDVWMAHFALSDIDGNRFYHTERLNRTGVALAGASLKDAKVWNGNWQARWSQDWRTQNLEATAADFQIRLCLVSAKPPVIHGRNGVSQKAQGEGRASHYISLTRLAANGTLTIQGKEWKVEGLAWMDHEFFTHQLASDQSGWDWFSLQFDDGTELMLFRLRRKDGTPDPYSAGTYIDARGTALPLSSGDFSVSPGKTWRSPETGARYPLEWKVQVPSLALNLSASTRLPQQELISKGGAVSAYWEGAIEIAGTRQSRPLGGVGYIEMTGYAGPVRMGTPTSAND